MFNKGMGNIYKQAQQMKKKMAQVQEDLKKIHVEGSSGGGIIKVIVNGKKEIISINIDDSVLKEEDEVMFVRLTYVYLVKCIIETDLT